MTATATTRRLPLLIRLAARLSDGIRLCVTDGPASGTMMGYAYRNTPSGRGPIGRWVDRRFLAYAGWDGVRQRRRLLADLLVDAVDARHHEAAAPVHLLDLAGGTGDYVLDAVAHRPNWTSARCVDADPRAVAVGRDRARAARLDRSVTFDVGDVTDRNTLAADGRVPDVVCCSGLYELMNDATVGESVRRVADLLPVGGRFVVSHQAARPSVGGPIARAVWRPMAASVGLTMRSGDALAALLATAGFAVERRESAANLYAVLLARRVA